MNRILYLTLVTTIVFVAHAEGELNQLSETLWRALRSVNLDISMTPFTTDMNFMQSESGFYSRSMAIVVENSSGQKHKIDPRRLSVSRTKMPILMMSESHKAGGDVQGAIYAVCRSMSYELKMSVKSFEIVVEPFLDGDQAFLINQPINCEGPK